MTAHDPYEPRFRAAMLALRSQVPARPDPTPIPTPAPPAPPAPVPEPAVPPLAETIRAARPSHRRPPKITPPSKTLPAPELPDEVYPCTAELDGVRCHKLQPHGPVHRGVEDGRPVAWTGRAVTPEERQQMNVNIGRESVEAFLRRFRSDPAYGGHHDYNAMLVRRLLDEVDRQVGGEPDEDDESTPRVWSVNELGEDAVLGRDFYRCPNKGEWVYRWADERYALKPVGEPAPAPPRPTMGVWAGYDDDPVEDAP